MGMQAVMMRVAWVVGCMAIVGCADDGSDVGNQTDGSMGTTSQGATSTEGTSETTNGTGSSSAGSGTTRDASTSSSTGSATDTGQTEDPTTGMGSSLCDEITVWAQDCEPGSDAQGTAAECPIDARIAEGIGGGCLAAFMTVLDCIVALDCAAYDSASSCAVERAAAMDACL